MVAYAWSKVSTYCIHINSASMFKIIIDILESLPQRCFLDAKLVKTILIIYLQY